ncbi:MAG: restriction endonuclease subunit S [Burkholderiales bacterium]|jgi:type I restriction enzyme S subunit|uniref:restriction endonuclease subunit S n=1 Tax=Limnobacter sp. TaxID=2003368 RepID=UPI0039BC9CF3|nr:restriction endonuclease subunit S [Burkholderiales bacterium]
MVPSNWKLSPLKDLLEGSIKNGFSPNPAESETGYWVLGLGALGEEGINSSEIKPVSPEEKVLKNLLEIDDFLVSRSNTPDKVGRSVRFRGEVDNCSYPDLMMRFRINQNKVDKSFIEQQLKSSKVRAYFKNCAAGSSSTMVKINKGILENTPILTPSLLEQKKIAQILSTWDQAITITEQALANSQQQKKALMQQLLTCKKRLLDKNGVRFEGEWIHGRLGELCAFKGGSAFKEVYQGQSIGDLPFIKVSDMNLLGNERSIKYSNNWVSFETAKLMKAKPFPKSSIIFAKVGAALLLNRRRILSRPTIIDNNMMAAVPSNAADTEFLYQLLLAIDFARFVQEGAVPSINQGDLSSFKISYPDVEEQQKIATVLSNSDQQISALQQKLDVLKKEKKALMQQLLTGKRRVKIDDKEVA